MTILHPRASIHLEARSTGRDSRVEGEDAHNESGDENDNLSRRPSMRQRSSSLHMLQVDAANSKPLVADPKAKANPLMRRLSSSKINPSARPDRIKSDDAAAAASRASHSILAHCAQFQSAVIYFAIGALVYRHLEGWEPLDAIYFMITTSTTVGYGDLAPASPAGRAFTCLYALLGTTIIISALSPLVETLLDAVRAWLNHFVPLAVDTSDENLTLEQINTKISYRHRYARAMLGPLLLFLIGALYAFFALHMGPIDAICACRAAIQSALAKSRRPRPLPLPSIRSKGAFLQPLL